MTLRWIQTLVFAGLAACERHDSETSESASKVPTREVPVSYQELEPLSPTTSDSAATLAAQDSFEEAVLAVSDEDIGTLLDAIHATEDTQQRRQMIETMYEETVLRPEFIRLPLLLELARNEASPPSLSTTILAELGTTLETDHGRSWADWSLALEEYLEESHGLIRVEETELPGN